MRRVSPILFSIAFLCSFHITASEQYLDGRSAADIQRDKTSHPEKIIHFAGIKEGDRVLDFFGGGGYYSEILSGVVGTEGHVVLHNNQGFLNYVNEALQNRLAGNRLKNVTRLDSEADDLKLGNGQFDYAFIVLGLHDMYYKDTNWDIPVDSVLKQIRQSLKPEGKLLIIDHNSKAGTGAQKSQELHRIEDAYAKAQIEKLGFKLVAETNILRNPKDDLTKSVFDPEIKRKTDRFVYLFAVNEIKQ